MPEKKSLGRKEWKIKQRANCTTRESFFSHFRPRRGGAGLEGWRLNDTTRNCGFLSFPAQQPRLPPALRRPSQDQGKEAGDSHSHPFYRKAKAFLGSPW